MWQSLFWLLLALLGGVILIGEVVVFFDCGMLWVDNLNA